MSSRTDARGAAMAESSRGAILRAAAAVIAEKGVRGLRVEEVADRAGVSTPLLYYHFHNRTGLVRAALDHSHEQAPSTALTQAEQQGSGFEVVLLALLAELDDDSTIRDNNVVWNEASATAVFDADLRPDIKRVTRAWEHAVATGIRRGIDDGSIPAAAEPDLCARILTVLVDGVSERWLAGILTLEDARHVLGDAVRRVLLCPAPPAGAGSADAS